MIKENVSSLTQQNKDTNLVWLNLISYVKKLLINFWWKMWDSNSQAELTTTD